MIDQVFLKLHKKKTLRNFTRKKIKLTIKGNEIRVVGIRKPDMFDTLNFWLA